ncbi:hypothetical protein B0H13DRAFT_2364219 [Mycena leptocephala]|nr:hypothetical protein B0H13DRAFT_2364219 [Mycena leptocephala]
MPKGAHRRRHLFLRKARTTPSIEISARQPSQKPRLLCSNALHPSIESGCTPPPARMRPRPPFPVRSGRAVLTRLPRRSTPPRRSLTRTTTSPLYFTARRTTPLLPPILHY